MGGIHSLDGSRNLNEPDAPRCPRQMGVHYCTTQLGLSYSETATTVPALSKGYVSIHSLLEVRECPRTTWWTVFVYIYIYTYFSFVQALLQKLSAVGRSFVMLHVFPNPIKTTPGPLGSLGTIWGIVLLGQGFFWARVMCYARPIERGGAGTLEALDGVFLVALPLLSGRQRGAAHQPRPVWLSAFERGAEDDSGREKVRKHTSCKTIATIQYILIG